MKLTNTKWSFEWKVYFLLSIKNALIMYRCGTYVTAESDITYIQDGGDEWR
jgi:hypothetical protein